MAQFEVMKMETADFKAKQAFFETIAARLDVLERQINSPIPVEG